MKRTPIIILTKDNSEYLYATLKSLTATDLRSNPVIIVDDCSSMEKTKKFLYTNEVMEVKFDDWTIKDDLSSQEYADKEAAESFINVPQITSIAGIKGKFTIVKTPRYLGQIYRTLFGINLAFKIYPGAEDCIILEDDILFNKDWLNKMIEIKKYEYLNRKIGMISSYSELLRSNDQPMYFSSDRIKGKAVMVSKKFYDVMKSLGLLSTMDLKGEGSVYNRLQNLAERTGFVCLSSRDSYIQNLEKRNLVNKDKVLKYDRNFVMPIAWNEKF